MSLVRFKAQNHPQQTAAGGPRDEVDDRRTPPELFDALHAEFRFTLDAAASSENAKLNRFFDYQANGLAQSWKGERVWCNPPYSNIAPWVEKAWAEMRSDCELVAMLIPANRTEQRFWQEHIEPFRDGGRERSRDGGASSCARGSSRDGFASCIRQSRNSATVQRTDRCSSSGAARESLFLVHRWPTADAVSPNRHSCEGRSAAFWLLPSFVGVCMTSQPMEAR